MKYEPLWSIFIQFSAAVLKETINRRDSFRFFLNHEYKCMKTLGQTHAIYFCLHSKDVDKIHISYNKL